MSSTLTLILITAALLFLIFLFVYFFRERAEVLPEKDLLILKQPFKEKKLRLDQELQSWKLQEAYYLRWGRVYAINMLFKNGKRKAISSRFNLSNFERLHEHLNRHYKKREVPG